MLGGIVVSHGLFAQGILSSCDMIFGNHEGVKGVCLKEGVSSFEEELNGTLDNMFAQYDSIVVFADLKGGTPYNQVLKYKLEKDKKDMKIIVGVNLPMLIEFLSVLNTSKAEQVAPELTSIGRKSIFEASMPQVGSSDDDILD